VGSRDGVRFEDTDGARWVTIERPPLNVLDVATIESIGAAVSGLESRRELKAVVVRSGIPRTFSAGADVRDHARERVGLLLDAFHGLFRTLEGLAQVTVAMVDGTCLGGGCELAIACDIVLATPRSVFGQPEIDVGCFPPLASVLLPRVAPRAAAELLFTGAPIAAGEAARVGLISRVADDIEAEARRVVRLLAGKSAVVLALARRARRLGAMGAPVEALAAVDRLYREALVPTADAEEGVQAFLEKRPPRWRDE